MSQTMSTFLPVILEFYSALICKYHVISLDNEVCVSEGESKALFFVDRADVLAIMSCRKSPSQAMVALSVDHRPEKEYIFI